MLNRVLLILLGFILGIKAAYLIYDLPVAPECISPSQESRIPEPTIFQPSPPRFWAL